MNKKILYILLLLSLFILISIGLNFIEIKNIRKDKYNRELEDKIKVLFIKLDSYSLQIKKGDKLKLNYNKKNVNVSIDNNRVELEEINDNKGIVDITVPEDFSFNQLIIESNRGSITLNDLTTEFFSLSSKSGDVEINNFNVTNKADFSLNSSKMTIMDSTIHNIDLYNGNGNFNYEGILDGRSEIYTSKGSINLNLKDQIDKYKVEIKDNNKSIIVNNKIIDNSSYTKGKKEVLIYGKGKLNISTKEGKMDEEK